MEIASGRGAKALRLLLLFIVVLAFAEFLLGSIYEGGRVNLSPQAINYNLTMRNRTQQWPQRLFPSLYDPPLPTYDYVFTNETYGLPLQFNMEGTDSSTYNYTKDDLCPKIPPGLVGPVKVNTTHMSIADVDLKYPEVNRGGWYTPKECKPRHKVAIIVPFRDRESHLALFLNHMHPFLMRQQLDYGVFIIEQNGNSPFNRAKLMNVGFIESQKLRKGGWDCFIFHDIDLLPIDDRNLYSCPKQPRHMSAAIDRYNYRLPYASIFGGVSALTLKQFKDVNGFSNNYWGWGGEDDDLASRIKLSGYHVARYPMSIARYIALAHQSQKPNPQRFKLLREATKRYRLDGITTLDYEVQSVNYHHLYTAVLVNLSGNS